MLRVVTIHRCLTLLLNEHDDDDDHVTNRVAMTGATQYPRKYTGQTRGSGPQWGPGAVLKAGIVGLRNKFPQKLGIRGPIN